MYSVRIRSTGLLNKEKGYTENNRVKTMRPTPTADSQQTLILLEWL